MLVAYNEKYDMLFEATLVLVINANRYIDKPLSDHIASEPDSLSLPISEHVPYSDSDSRKSKFGIPVERLLGRSSSSSSSSTFPQRLSNA